MALNIVKERTGKGQRTWKKSISIDLESISLLKKRASTCSKGHSQWWILSLSNLLGPARLQTEVTPHAAALTQPFAPSFDFGFRLYIISVAPRVSLFSSFPPRLHFPANSIPLPPGLSPPSILLSPLCVIRRHSLAFPIHPRWHFLKPILQLSSPPSVTNSAPSPIRSVLPL